MGDLVCISAAGGKEVWRKNLPKDLAAEVNPIGGGPKKLGWGFTCSPIIDGERLICIPGGPQGTLAALDKRTGEVLWRSSEVTDQAAYTSPVVAEIHGTRQCIALTNQGLFGVHIEDGRVLWSYRRKFSTEVVNTPIVSGSLAYVTVGAGQGCDLVRIEKEGDDFKPVVQYTNKNMTNHHGNVLLHQGHVFGFAEGKGWTCQNLESGEVAWAERRQLRAGSLVFGDGRLYLYGEDDGTVVLIEASTAGWSEKGRFKIPQQSKQRKPSGKIWTPPVISGGRLFVRDQELLYCYRIAAEQP
jgi:outer membrane protein assembly factor BamB